MRTNPLKLLPIFIEKDISHGYISAGSSEIGVPEFFLLTVDRRDLPLLEAKSSILIFHTLFS